MPLIVRLWVYIGRAGSYKSYSHLKFIMLTFWTCFICSLPFLNQQSLLQHSQEHEAIAISTMDGSEIVSLQCVFCDQMSDNQAAHDHHVHLHTEPHQPSYPFHQPTPLNLHHQDISDIYGRVMQILNCAVVNMIYQCHSVSNRQFYYHCVLTLEKIKLWLDSTAPLFSWTPVTLQDYAPMHESLLRLINYFNYRLTRSCNCPARETIVSQLQFLGQLLHRALRLAEETLDVDMSSDDDDQR